VGVVFVHSGWGKLHHLSKVEEFFRNIGIPFPSAQAPFVGTTELVCGALLLVGLAARIVSIPLIATMAVALWTAKRGDISGLNDLFGTSEFLYIVMLLFVIASGAGPISADRYLQNSRK
ncbi:MAG: DoxX family protein, partial [Bdellovibrionota bacterium]